MRRALIVVRGRGPVRGPPPRTPRRTSCRCATPASGASLDVGLGADPRPRVAARSTRAPSAAASASISRWTPDDFGYWEFEAPGRRADLHPARVAPRDGVGAARRLPAAAPAAATATSSSSSTETRPPGDANTLAEFTGLNAIDVGSHRVLPRVQPAAAGRTRPQNRVTFTRMEMVLRGQRSRRAPSVRVAGHRVHGIRRPNFTGRRRRRAPRRRSLVDGAEAGRTATFCSQPYASAVPCPLSGRAEAAAGHARARRTARIACSSR